jgi:gluconolactonase
MPTLTGTPMRIAGVPPADSFNMNNGTFGIIEGPVWTGSELYVSELGNMPYDAQNSDMKMARLLKVTPDGKTSIVVADSGSNGLALAADGSLVGGVHKDGTIKRFALPGGAATTLVNGYMNVRFNSPNDVAIHSNGTIYFSDPTYNGPTQPPQAAMRAYRVAPGGSTAEPIPSSASPDTFTNPNGMTLSLAEDYLYVASDMGRRYPVMADGTLGAGADWAATTGGDGMVIDCAGNLYVALANTQNIAVFTPAGTSIGMIKVTGVQAVTNLAFGGADRKTLYITGYGNDKGLFQLPLNLPGRPY